MPQEIQDALQTLIETGDSVGESDMDPAVLEKLKNYLGEFSKKIDLLKTLCPDNPNSNSKKSFKLKNYQLEPRLTMFVLLTINQQEENEEMSTIFPLLLMQYQ